MFLERETKHLMTRLYTSEVPTHNIDPIYISPILSSVLMTPLIINFQVYK